MDRNRISSQEKKMEPIRIRCSKKEKELIKKKAMTKGKSISSYMRDCSMAGLERKSDRDRKNIKVMIANQEILNNLAEDMKLNKGKRGVGFIQEMLKELMEGEFILWEN